MTDTMRLQSKAILESGEFDGGTHGGAGSPGAAALKSHVPGELLVQFSPGADASARDAAISSVGGRAAEVVRGHGLEAASNGLLLRVSLGAGVSVEKAIEILSRRPGVTFAEPNYTYSIDATSNDPAYTGGQLWGMYGDQTSPTNQYGSQAGEAWAAGHTGSSKVVVGVVDTGIDYKHPDLYLNVWLNQGEIPTAFRSSLADVDGDGVISFRDLNSTNNSSYVSDVNGNGRIDAGDLLNDSRWENGLDDNSNGYIDDLIGWDFVNGDNDPYDDNNHGTHVSGTIAATGGNGTGVAGVSWATQIIGLKFLSGSGSGSLSGAIKALDYFTAASKTPNGQDFAATNNSWGGGDFAQSLLDSISAGARQNILFVAAAGNGGSDGVGDNTDSTANYPSNYNTTAQAGYDAVISVASLTSSGSLSSFSNYGSTTVDLAAPGSGIYSTVAGGGYATFSGTSMATPHVTGAIALYSAMSGQSAAEIRSTLFASTVATSSLDGKTATGGRLDAATFVSKAIPTTAEPANIYGTTASDTIVGTSAGEKIWGVPSSGSHVGRGTIDKLTGNGGNDVFVFGDARGRFYDDGKGRSSGTSDYALVTDFGSGDKIQFSGSGNLQNPLSLNGVSGMGIYHDSNGNGAWDSRDELVGLLAGVTQQITSDQWIIV